MSTNFLRKYIDIINENAASEGPVSQKQLTQLYPQGKPLIFIKKEPVAIVPFTSLEKTFGKQNAQKLAGLAGLVDKTSYEEAYRSKGYVIIQWSSKTNQPDVYIAGPEAVASDYTRFTGALPSDAKARSKVPSLVALDQLGLDANRVPFFVKKVPTEMISADQIGLAGKVIQTSWGGQPGEQTVQSGGFLVREPNGHIYTVGPDAQGLPIGYIPA